MLLKAAALLASVCLAGMVAAGCSEKPKTPSEMTRENLPPVDPTAEPVDPK